MPPPRHGLARELSKRGFCSRAEAWRLIQAGRVTVNGRTCRDPEWPTILGRDQLGVDGQTVRVASKVYVMLNKPRGLVTTTADEKGRPTVYECFRAASLPPISPVGRLDRASEGLLFFTNDHDWAARLTNPSSDVAKVYHVHIDRVADERLCQLLRSGGDDQGELLSASRASILRENQSTSWLELVLNEGRNRHIRRLLGLFDINVLRLVRVRIGHVQLGALPKGGFRHLTAGEIGRFTSADNQGPLDPTAIQSVKKGEAGR